MAQRVRVREIDDGRRRIIRRGTGSVVTWRRAQTVLLAAQGMPVAKIAKSTPVEHGLTIVCDNYSPHLTTKRCQRVATWATANNVEIAYTRTNSSWLNRIEAQFTALLDTGVRHPNYLRDTLLNIADTARSSPLSLSSRTIAAILKP